jgi:putative addiction module CopG family antidote
MLICNFIVLRYWLIINYTILNKLTQVFSIAHHIICYTESVITYVEESQMNILLTPKQEVFVQLQIQGGEYENVDQVIEAALLLLQQRHQSLDSIRQKIELGAAQIPLGQTTDGAQVSDRPQQKLDSGRSRLSLEEMRKMIGTDKPA